MSIFRTFYSITNQRGFEAQLEKISDARRKLCERASQQTAYNVKTRAKLGAPRDQGDLIDVISVQGKGLIWRVGLLDVSLPSRGGNSAHQHPWVYGVWYEFGFVSRNIARHAYMGPAVESEQAAHEQRIAAAVNGSFQVAA